MDKSFDIFNVIIPHKFIYGFKIPDKMPAYVL